MKKTKSKKNELIKLGIISFVWLLVIFGLSFAYFSIVFDDTDETDVTVETGQLDIDFITGQYIDNEPVWPINDSDIFTSDDVSEFTVARSSSNTTDNVYYNIYLQDIVITENYESPYVKWKLYNVENPTSSSTAISEGTFEDLNGATSIQLNRERISLPDNVTHHYTLYIWISNDENGNQLGLLNGSIEAKVEIVAVSQ